MQRFIDHAGQRAERSRARCATLGIVAALLALVAFPALAPAATQTLTVEKVGTGTGTVKSSPVGIECGVTCSAPFAEGTEVVLKAVSGPNTAAVVWSGCSKKNLENECFVTIGSTPKSVTATFNLLERKLTVSKEGAGTGTVTSSPAGISCGTSCTSAAASFVKGTVVTLTGTPGAGSLAVDWAGCESNPSPTECVVTMSAVKTVVATFDLPSFQLSVSRTGSGTGTVTSSPAGIECGTTCQASFVEGTIVTLTGTPGLHSQAVEWSGCKKVNGENKCLVSVDGAKSVTATFEIEPQWALYTIAVQRTGTGQGTVTSSPAGIECGADCSESYLYQTKLTLTATPAEGSEFVQWVGGTCTGQTGPCTSTVTKARLIKAVFAVVGTRALTVHRAGSGTGTVTSSPIAIDCGQTCSTEFAAGAKVALTATAGSGSRFAGWSGACSGVATCEVSMTEARDVTATFEKDGSSASQGTIAVGGSAKVKGGKALLRLFCNGLTRCQGTLKLIAKISNAQGQVKGLVIARARYDLVAGAFSVLKVKLSSRGLELLRGQDRPRVRVTGSGIAGRFVKLAI